MNPLYQEREAGCGKESDDSDLIKTPEFWELDKPTIVGESPGTAGQYTVQEMVDNTFENGYAGIMPWSYNALDGHGTWDEVKVQLKVFRDAHAELVDYTPAVVATRFRRPARMHALSTGEIRAYDLRGRKIRTAVGGVNRAVRNSTGVVLYERRTLHGDLIGVEKRLSPR